MDVVGGIALVAGSLFLLLGGVGAVRFDDIFARLHSAAKGPTLGLLLTGLGVMLVVRTTNAVVTVLLVIILQLIAGPVGAHIIGRSIYRMRPTRFGTDELADAED